MQLFKGNEAEVLLNDAQFIKDWRTLLASCPWATVFQSPEFILTWYNTFPDYERILVCHFEAGIPVGILCLTIDQGGIIVGAGTNLAEYQTWICRPDDERFASRAFETLTKQYPNKLIQIKYVPEGCLPMGHQQKVGSTHALLSLVHGRPLMENDIESLEKELKKKNRKEKINRLNRLGKLEFEKITELKRFVEVLPQLVLQNDLRKGAMYGKTAFIDEPERNGFLIALFNGGMIHASLLKVGNEIIASNVGILGDGKVYLQGLNTISPYYTKYSPGILHFLILGKHLASEDIPEFDLTPGGTDGYKSMLATKSLQCQELFIGRYPRIVALRARQYLKEWLGKQGVSKKVSDTISEISRLQSFIRNLEIKTTYSFNPLSERVLDQRSKVTLNQALNGNAHRFEPMPVDPGKSKVFFDIGQKMGVRSRQKFYQDCLRRMELGQKSHVICLDEEYAALIWSWKTTESHLNNGHDQEVWHFEFSYTNDRADFDKVEAASSICHAINTDRLSQCILLE